MRNIGYGRRSLSLVTFCFVTLLAGSPTDAFDVLWTGGTGSWNTASNWSGGFVPYYEAEEVAVINNGGTATLNAAATGLDLGSQPKTPLDAAGLVLGQGVGDSGALHLQSGGLLNLVASTGAPTGAANIGLAGTGVLQVDGGATFSTASLDVNPGSMVEIGAGSGVASVVSSGGIWLAGTTITHGAGHEFSASFVNLEVGSEYVVDLQSSSHTTLVATGPIGGVLGQPLIVTASNGYTPVVGTTWTILDGTFINGAFALDVSALPSPGPGVRFAQRIVPGGNGQQLQLSYEAAATLTVNAATGAMSMSSESGAPISILGYSIGSAVGALDPAGWSSLDEQEVGGDGVWQEAAPTTTALSELISNNTDTLSLNSSAIAMGNGYAFAPTAFGESPDIEFEYIEADGQVVQGQVKYTGAGVHNNLLLTVDPSTGDAQLKNDSAFTIDMVGYAIASASGSLQPGDSDWSSLDDQDVGGADTWQEAAPTEFSLAELVFSGDQTLTMSPGQAYLIGDLFDNISGAQDLELEFMLDGVPASQLGVVVYGPIGSSLIGDYNEDGVVDSIDYAVWREHLGDAADSIPNRDPSNTGVISQDDFNSWMTHYGATAVPGATTAQAAPEPAMGWIGILGATWCWCAFRSSKAC